MLRATRALVIPEKSVEIFHSRQYFFYLSQMLAGLGSHFSAEPYFLLSKKFCKDFISLSEHRDCICIGFSVIAFIVLFS